MKKWAVGLMVLWLALASAGASAQLVPEERDGQLMRGWIKNDQSQFIIVMEVDAGRSADMYFEYANDTTLIEDELDVMVVKEQDASRSQLRTLGADQMTLRSAVTEDGNIALIVVAQADEYVYLMVIATARPDADLDGALFAEVSVDVIQNGLKNADDPKGYREEPMADSL